MLRFEILEIWPQCNESNVRVFVSMLISFAIEQINQEIEDATASDESHQALNEPQPHATLKSNDTPITAKNPKLAGLSKFPVTLKAYTKALVSWDTITKEGERVTIKGYIDYGPEALKTFYIIAETKMVGGMSDQSWAQLLSLYGSVSPSFVVVALLMMEKGIIQQNGKVFGK